MEVYCPCESVTWVSGEVGLAVLVALRVVPEVCRHGGEGREADQLAGLVIHPRTCTPNTCTHTNDL